MNRLIMFIFFAISGASMGAYADTYSYTGKIKRLGTILIRDESDYIILSGFTSAGSCPTTSNGLVTVRIPYGESGDRSYSMALSAYASGVEITVAVDDSNKHPIDGGCFLKSMEVTE